MPAPYKPAGHPSVSPYLLVDGAERTLDFLVHVLGGKLLLQAPGPEGRVRHAEVRLDDSVIMVADSMPGYPAVPSHIHIYVQDVDDCYHRALSWGAASVQEPVKKDDPDKRGGVKDPGGTTWWLATRME